MRVIEADDVLSLLSRSFLRGDQLVRRDVVAVLRRSLMSVLARNVFTHNAVSTFKFADQNSAAFMRIRLFGVPADGFVMAVRDLQHVTKVCCQIDSNR